MSSSLIRRWRRHAQRTLPAMAQRSSTTSRRLAAADLVPDDFPRTVRVGYTAESKQLVVERQLPTIDCVPEVATYRYVRSRAVIATSSRSIAQRRSIYSAVVA